MKKRKSSRNLSTWMSRYIKVSLCWYNYFGYFLALQTLYLTRRSSSYAGDWGSGTGHRWVAGTWYRDATQTQWRTTCRPSEQSGQCRQPRSGKNGAQETPFSWTRLPGGSRSRRASSFRDHKVRHTARSLEASNKIWNLISYCRNC